MSTLYITQQDATLRKVDERLKVTVKKDVLLDVPMIKVSQVVLYGRVTVTAATVAALMERQIEICYLTQHGQYIGRLQPKFSKNSLLRREQYRAAFDPARCLQLARGFVLGKLLNMRTWLMRMNRKQEHPEIEQAINRIKLACDAAEHAKTLDQLRGHEGEGSAAYFAVFHHLLKYPDFTFEKRVKRPPTDPVNSLLSFGYTLLANELFAAVNVVGFDPYIGYLHAEKYGRASLPLDLIEEFRPVIVDSVVVSAINKEDLTRKDFQEEMGNVLRLTPDGRKKFLKLYEERKRTEFKHPILQQKMTYQHCFEQQARFLAKTLQGELEEYPPLLIK
jgi:CRISPR-associated protein Cas1